jgi:hypothetical protein
VAYSPPHAHAIEFNLPNEAYAAPEGGALLLSFAGYKEGDGPAVGVSDAMAFSPASSAVASGGSFAGAVAQLGPGRSHGYSLADGRSSAIVGEANGRGEALGRSSLNGERGFAWGEAYAWGDSSSPGATSRGGSAAEAVSSALTGLSSGEGLGDGRSSAIVGEAKGRSDAEGDGQIMEPVFIVGVAAGGSFARADNALRLGMGVSRGRSRALPHTPRYASGISRGGSFARAVNLVVTGTGKAVGKALARAVATRGRPARAVGASFARAYAPVPMAGTAHGGSAAWAVSGYAAAAGLAAGASEALAVSALAGPRAGPQVEVFVRMDLPRRTVVSEPVVRFQVSGVRDRMEGHHD